jgi:Putative Ig domain
MAQRHRVRMGRVGLRVLILCGILLPAIHVFAATTVAVFPTGVTFPPQPNGTISGPQNVTVYNLGSTTVTLTGFTSTIPEYVISGTIPVTIAPGTWANFTVTFHPDSAKTFSGNLTATFDIAPTQKATVTGLGTSLTAVATLNKTSLSFASQPLGTTSPTQAVTITNTGTTQFKVTGVTITYPFSQTGFTTAVVVSPGKSLTLQVSFFPVAIGSTNGTMLITYDVLPNAGVSMTGTGAAATSLGIDTYPTLPSATQNAAYQVTLAAVGGVAPYTWALASGSTLPAGLSLSSSGAITGSLASTVATGKYFFTAMATDSNSSSVSADLTLPVFATTGAACNNIVFNASDGTGPLVPINDLGTNSYLGVEEGGLYANGSNVRPSDHDSYGVNLANGIQPLDANGNPSSTGKYALISIGESCAQQPFIEFSLLANADPSKNPNLVLVNGATGGATASLLASPNNNFWNVINNDYLPNAGVTSKQVVAAWVNDVNGGPAGTFPSDMTKLQGNFESIAQNLLTKFPNIKIAYFTSINYTGYSNGVKNLSNEPWSYEAGFAVKNTIQDQLNGNANLNFDPTKGVVKAPWIDWGPYYWANGMSPRSDGLIWTCQDLQGDGTHPSNPVGRVKVSTQLLNFLKTDDTASIWFLAH